MENESELNFDAEVESSIIKKQLRIAIIKKENNMSSNYPPGVTGNEYEIAGADYEVEDTFVCNNVVTYVKVDSKIANHISYIRERMRGKIDTMNINDKLEMYKWLDILQMDINNASKPFDEVCGYDGEIIKEAYKGMLYWECPNCRKTYEEEIYEDIDPEDYYRDKYDY